MTRVPFVCLGDICRSPCAAGVTNALTRQAGALRPAGNATPVRLFSDDTRGETPRHVPDPHYARDFDGTPDLVERCARGLVAELGRRD